MAGNAPLTGTPCGSIRNEFCVRRAPCRSAISLTKIAQINFRADFRSEGIGADDKIWRCRTKSDEAAIGADSYLLVEGALGAFPLTSKVSCERLRRAASRTQTRIANENVPRRATGNQIRCLGVKSDETAICTHRGRRALAVCGTAQRAYGNEFGRNLRTGEERLVTNRGGNWTNGESRASGHAPARGGIRNLYDDSSRR